MTIAHRAARVFDGHDLREGIDVLTDGPTIVAVARRGDTPPDVEILDHGPDSTLLPGLVDAHTHLVFSCIPDVPAGVPHDADGLDRLIRDNARRALAGGVTTVRDLGDSGYAVLAVREETADDPSYPRILGAGPPLTTVGGHCAFLDGAAVTGTIGDAVAERLDRGVDVVKIMSSGGNVTANSTPPWLSQFVVAELREVVDAVHARGIPVAAHAHGSKAIRDAVAAGVDSIEHCTFMTADGTSRTTCCRMARRSPGGWASIRSTASEPRHHGRLRCWGSRVLWASSRRALTPTCSSCAATRWPSRRASSTSSACGGVDTVQPDRRSVRIRYGLRASDPPESGHSRRERAAELAPSGDSNSLPPWMVGVSAGAPSPRGARRRRQVPAWQQSRPARLRLVRPARRR